MDEEKANKEKSLLAKATEEERKENEKKFREETEKRLKRMEDVKRKVLEEDSQIEEMKRQEFQERKRRLSIYTGRLKDMTTPTPTNKNEDNENENTTNKEENKEENDNNNNDENINTTTENNNNNNNNTTLSTTATVADRIKTTPITTNTISSDIFSPIPTKSPTLQFSNISNYNNDNNYNNNSMSILSTRSSVIESDSNSNYNNSLPPLHNKIHHNSYPVSEYDSLLPSSPISTFKTSQSLPALSERSTPPTEVVVRTRYLNYGGNNGRRYNGMRRRIKMKILTPIQQTSLYPTLDVHSNIPSYLTPNVTVSPIK